ncbi:MAG: phosphate signaling complex protein PhoU [Oscillospiraceae bacterium]|nr:phosphate signaling complex protein PhoU [Oscillospiraceae bacterium]
MRKTFDEQLDQLNESMIQMGAYCEQAIGFAVKALADRDQALAHKAIETDGEIDRMERDIEAMCLRLLLQQQPVASDLRFISSALKMITDIERIGDQASDISEIVLLLTEQEGVTYPKHIHAMAEAAIDMVGRSVDAYVKKDLALAKKVIAMDDTVDGLFDTVKSELIGRIAADPNCGEQALDILMIAKYLERIGDHATNIAEWVEFSLLGMHPEAQT